MLKLLNKMGCGQSKTKDELENKDKINGNGLKSKEECKENEEDDKPEKKKPPKINKKDDDTSISQLNQAKK